MLHPNLRSIFELIDQSIQQKTGTSKRGRPYVYKWCSMLLFFTSMMKRSIYSFKGMEQYVRLHYARYGFEKAPSRFTLSRRFAQLPCLLQWLIPQIAQQAFLLDERFRFYVGYVDKSLFKAKGGIWHKKHMLSGIVPHSSIDTEASWGKSAHFGWRFGYGLHLICNAYRFPVAALITTGSAKDIHQVLPLTRLIKSTLYLLLGDKGYKAVRPIKKLLDLDQIMLLNGIIYKMKSRFKDWLSKINSLEFARSLYRKRKTSVEPLFSLIKELFDLKNESQLPFKGLKKNQSFLMLATFSTQIMMIYNTIFYQNLGHTHQFFNLLD